MYVSTCTEESVLHFTSLCISQNLVLIKSTEIQKVERNGNLHLEVILQYNIFISMLQCNKQDAQGHNIPCMVWRVVTFDMLQKPF